MAKKTRIKSAKQGLIQIRDWAEADKLVGAIGELQAGIEEREQKARIAIDEIKAALAAGVKPIRETIEHSVASLEAYATAHRDELGKARRKKLALGSVGWRKSTSIRVKGTTLERIKAVFSAAKARILIRTKETVDKEALAKLTDEALASIAARREEKDVFYVEPSKVEAAEY